MTTEPQNGLQKLLEDRRSAILEEFRKLKPELVKEFLQLNILLNRLSEEEPESPSDEYFGFRSPTEAILQYLDKVVHAVPKERIAKDVEAGGYGRGQINRPYWTLIATVNYHLEDRNKKIQDRSEKPGERKNKKILEPQIVERNGLIGRPEWPEELFLPERQ